MRHEYAVLPRRQGRRHFLSGLARSSTPCTESGPHSPEPTLRDEHPEAATMLATHRRWWPQICGCSEEDFLRVAETICCQLRPGAHHVPGVCRWAGRITPPVCRSSAPLHAGAVAARQYRAAGWRHHGNARTCQHPGIHRRADALRYVAGLPGMQPSTTRGHQVTLS